MIGYYFRDSNDYSFYHICCHNFSLCVIWNIATLLTCCNTIKLACSQPPNCIGCILLFTCDNENNKLKHPFPLCEWRNLQVVSFPHSCKRAFQIFLSSVSWQKKKQTFECLRSIMKYERQNMPQKTVRTFSKWLSPLSQSFHGTCN